MAVGEAPPTYRDLCSELGWSSTGTVRDHLQALARKGLIELSGPRHRQVRLCAGAEAADRVPILGRIVAGTPIEANEEVEGFLPVPAGWTKGDDLFALRVAGDSMEGAGIRPGDFVVVKHRVAPKEGDIVAATLGGETTLKRLERRGKELFLVAENRRFKPIRVPEDQLFIHGVVIGLLRQYRAGSAFTLRRGGD